MGPGAEILCLEQGRAGGGGGDEEVGAPCDFCRGACDLDSESIPLEIVRIDLEMDEVPSSSSSGSWKTMDRQKKVLIADDTRMARDTRSAAASSDRWRCP